MQSLWVFLGRLTIGDFFVAACAGMLVLANVASDVFVRLERRRVGLLRARIREEEQRDAGNSLVEESLVSSQERREMYEHAGFREEIPGVFVLPHEKFLELEREIEEACRRELEAA